MALGELTVEHRGKVTGQRELDLEYKIKALTTTKENYRRTKSIEIASLEHCQAGTISTDNILDGVF